jgi:uridine kinase
MTDTAIRQLSSIIEARAAHKNGLYLVALDGRSGSGKSTLAAQLSERLDASIIEGDDFFAGGVVVLDSPASELANICIDWCSQRKAVQALHSQGTATYFPFDWDAFDGTRSSVIKEVRAKRVVILEGVYSARPELRDLIDFSVLIELADDLRMSRLLDREGEIGPWERQWHRAEDWYFENRAHREDFDAVLSWVSNHKCSLNLKAVRET